MKVTTLVVPAAGLGTRVLPLTKNLAKEMLPIADRPAMHYAAKEAADSGITRMALVIARGKESIAHYFTRDLNLERELSTKGKTKELAAISEPAKFFDSVVSIYQDEQKGLGHAVLCAKSAVGNDETFAISLPDDVMMCEPPCLRQMINACEKYGADGAIALVSVPPGEAHRYGIVAGRELDGRTIQIDTLVEKPKPGEAPSNLAIMGRYIANPYLFECIEKTAPGAVGEIQVTDALQQFAKTKKLIGVRYEGTRLDAGDMTGYIKTQFILAAQNPVYRKIMEDILTNGVPRDNAA
jgi:UTP--glucose-1-phosphate uridylyltransferase